jgi:PAS domain-containing protein
MWRSGAGRRWRRAESAHRLRDSEDHYRHTVELNPQGHLDGHAGRATQPSLEALAGLDRHDRTWRKLGERASPDDPGSTFEVWGRSVTTGEPYDIEHRVKMVDRELSLGEIARISAPRQRWKHLPWYGSTEDINEQKLAEERQGLLITNSITA